MAKKKDRDVASLPGEISDLLGAPSDDDKSSEDNGNSEQDSSAQSSNAQSNTTEQDSSGPLKTPAEWAKARGYFNPRNPRVPQSTDQIHPFHAAADALHGWSVDTHHYQGEHAFRLSEADYEAAITAGAEYPLVAPHRPAVTRSCPFDYADFKPKKRTKKASSRAGAGDKSTRRGNWRPFKSKR